MHSDDTSSSAELTLRGRVFEILEHGRRRDVAARLVDGLLVALILANVAAVIAQSVPEVAARYGLALQRFDRLCVVIFAIEYLARLWVAPEHPFGRELSVLAVRRRLAHSPMMIIDALALLPWLIEMVFPGDPVTQLTRLVRFLKLARYSPALATIGRVIAAERRALLACIIIISGVLLAAAAAMMAVEGHLQPNHLLKLARVFTAMAIFSTHVYAQAPQPPAPASTPAPAPATPTAASAALPAVSAVLPLTGPLSKQTMSRLLLTDAAKIGNRIVAVGDRGYIVYSDSNG